MVTIQVFKNFGYFRSIIFVFSSFVEIGHNNFNIGRSDKTKIGFVLLLKQATLPHDNHLLTI